MILYIHKKGDNDPYLFTISLFSSAAAPCHFSVSASISEDIIFISKPDFAIFACSSESNLTAFKGLLVVPCFYELISINITWTVIGHLMLVSDWSRYDDLS